MLRECNKINSFYFPVDYAATPISWYKGTALFMNGDIKAAIKEFENAHRSAPYHVQVLNDLGTCYDKEGNTNTAINYYTQALAVNPRFPNCILNLTAVLYNTGNTTAAYNILRTYPARYSNAQSLNFKTVILGKMAGSVLANIHTIQTNRTYTTSEWKQPKWLLKTEAEADSLHISFDDYFKTLISQK
jgi:Tfp pilus assembly protein PilF